MCIIFFIVNENATDSQYKLILAANRDEFFARPALPAAPWKEDNSVIGGRDMEPGREGGTWLAINAKDNVFKFGALLNITGETKDKDAKPRGRIVVDYVMGSKSNTDFCQDLIDSKISFNSFRLVSIEIDKGKAQPLDYCSATKTMQKWSPNEYLGFGNSLVAQPLQKVIAGKKLFEDIVKDSIQPKDELVQSLMDLLSRPEKHWPDDELHRRAPHWSESLSSIYVRIPDAGYGSRTRTVVLVDANNKVDFYEETMASNDQDGEWLRTHLCTEF